MPKTAWFSGCSMTYGRADADPAQCGPAAVVPVPARNRRCLLTDRRRRLPAAAQVSEQGGGATNVPIQSTSSRLRPIGRAQALPG